MIQPPASIISLVSQRVRDSMQVEVRGDARRITCRAMSTPVNIAFVTSSKAVARDLRLAAIDWIARFEACYSRFIPESIVGQINARAEGGGGGGDWLDLDEDADRLLSLCGEMHCLTRGVFDAAALPLLRIWDWKADPPRVPSESAIRAALEISGWDKVQRRPRGIRLPIAGMGIDLGGIGKEFAVDQLVSLARGFGISDVMIDIGQDIRVAGRSPGKDAWYIGLEEPDRPGECWTAVRLTDQAVATSGDYFRSFMLDGRRYGHILDPRSGLPVSNGSQAVSVIAPNCMMAGILSTAGFILGAEEGLELIREQRGAEACVTTEHARYQTRRFSSYVPA
jgi:thiamine biosynthesis lipoprotein